MIRTASRGTKNPVRSDAVFVVRFAKSVRIDRNKIERLADEWVEADIRAPLWMNDVHFHDADSRRLLTYVILLDSMNFCFWSKREKWHIVDCGKTATGYFALAIALRRWFERYPERSTFAYFQTMPWSDFREMLQGGEGLLLIRKRWLMVRAVSRVFMLRYGGDPVRFVAVAKERFSRLVPKIARELPSFDDRARFHGRQVSILKRAQILAGDIRGIFHGEGIGSFRDPGYLTAFADYKLPQFFRAREILLYAPALQKKIMNGSLISAGSREEVEIRAATIVAVEDLRAALLRRGVRMYSFQVDWLLWAASKRMKLPVPHHLTKTIFY
jgi:hypothetical protein